MEQRKERRSFSVDNYSTDDTMHTVIAVTQFPTRNVFRHSGY